MVKPVMSVSPATHAKHATHVKHTTPVTPTTPGLPFGFTLDDQKFDTTLDILGQTFLDHSFVLRMHSGVFHKLLEADGKPAPKSEGSSICYEYVTVVDTANTWSLTPKSKVSQSSYTSNDSNTRLA